MAKGEVCGAIATAILLPNIVPILVRLLLREVLPVFFCVLTAKEVPSADKIAVIPPPYGREGKVVALSTLELARR